ncbi:hypothetical protein [Microbulbifer litoralis]|uniref:hypothetical protein n=1 Tax=Microbulbifer litoralis TaxID=2933965 RepID=UPI0020277AF4|nr:hypothetical protein [Microbulbifer sp. GX H0434]
MKGIVWGVISYGVLWLCFMAVINIYGVPVKALGVLFVLCSALAGVVAAKNSKTKPIMNAAIAGGIVGIICSLAGLIFSVELTESLFYTTLVISLCFVAGAAVWWTASLLTSKSSRS